MPRRSRTKGSEQEDRFRQDSAYAPPILRNDTIDELVQRVDQQGSDKYRTPIIQLQSDVMSVSSVGSPSEASTNYESSPTRGVQSLSLSQSHSHSKSLRLLEEQMAWAEDDYYQVKQTFGYLSIGLSALQLLVLMMQLALCGVAPLDVNPMIGPYPDTFSEWGGKNAYLLVMERQYWRLLSPALLHVGVLHLLLNAYVQLETCAFFEREWGSCTWLLVYLLSEVGCILISCVANPDSIGVGSSGALMGLFGAKLAHVMSHTFFDVSSNTADSIQLEHLSSVLCSLVMMLGLSYMTYIDWSGHMGGLGIGFCAGMLAFSKPIRNPFSKFLWRMWGTVGLVGGLTVAAYLLWNETEQDEDLKDACTYFRNLFAEGYDCQCLI